MDLTTVYNFLADYGAAVALVVVIAGYGVWKWRKNTGQKKANVQVIAKAMDQPIIVQKEQESFADLFHESALEYRSQKDILTRVEHLTTMMHDEDRSVDTKMTSDLAATKEKLEKTQDALKHIKMYGMELARLYRKYEARENQLGMMVAANQELVERLGHSKSVLEDKTPKERTPVGTNS